MSARVHIFPGLHEDPGDPGEEEQEKRGKGRPPIGGQIRQELGDDLKAEVETYALGHDINRAAAVRRLVRKGLDLELDPMNRMAVVDGDELHLLLTHLDGDDIRRVRFALDGGLKVKVNEESWTLPFGLLHDSTQPEGR
ncbi:hypothetical protein [Amycolatopsis sp. CA-126428]|uniref:hypothetical protein n=1 Tax=Amycolatopsis sp. CA-126428 TaxID=2073158 RepID=UPI000CD157C5|nr:hypothetical protein [Amycolatopsis sp. CA-126428]